MDTFEDNGFAAPQPLQPEQPVPIPEPLDIPAPEPIPEAGREPVAPPAPEPIPEPARVPPVPRHKPSPYADSPYVMAAPEEPRWQYQPQTQPPAKKPRKKRHWKPLFTTAAMVIAGCLITAACVNSYWNARTEQTVAVLNGRLEELQRQIGSTAPSVPGSAGNSRPVTDGSAMTPAQVYSANVDSVVAITSTVESYYYGQSMEGSSSGSGFVLTENGYVVTNYHVVEGASAVHVTTHDGSEYEAQVVGFDSGNDVAVLKVEAEDLSPATLGSSNDLAIGDMVVAIGNPLGRLTSTQTVGYVSGINREVSTDNAVINMIQTDAAINSGNSGGPLFNMYGQVIGITTAKYSGTTGSGASIEGISFAIPIDDVVGMISDLMDYGYVTGAYLGVSVQNTDAESAAMFGLPTTGAYVVSVVEGGSADRAGIRPKDIIIRLGDHDVTSVTDLTRTLRQYKAGNTTTVTVVRSGSELVLGVTLDEKPHDDATASPEGETTPYSDDLQEFYEYFRRFFGE